MVYILGYGWYVILGLSLTPKQLEIFEVQATGLRTGKGCSTRRKWYWFMNSNMIKSVKYDLSIHFFHNIKTYTTIFKLVINLLVGQCTYVR